MPNEDTLYSAKHWAAKAKEYAEQASQGQIQSDWNQSDNTKKDFIKNKPTKLSDFTDDTASNPVSRATADASGNNIANTYATKTELNQKSSFKLFHHDWFDYQLNDQSWLRADTFSWQDGTVYSEAYNHLVDDVNGVITNWYSWRYSTTIPAQISRIYTRSSTPSVGDTVFDYQQGETTKTITSVNEDSITVSDGKVYSRESSQDITTGSQSETVGSYTITYYQAQDGHKICLPDQETTVQNIYNESGVAWYYILDTTNQRFKLPRINPAREELLQTVPVVGNGTALGLLADTGVGGTLRYLYQDNLPKFGFSQLGSNVPVGTAATSWNTNNNYFNKAVGVTTNETNSGIIAKFSGETTTSVFKGKKYLYFYVGQFSQTATEQTAGLNSELFNGKVDLNAANLSAQGKSLISSLGMPSTRYDDLTLGASGSTYTAPANGYYSLKCQINNTGAYIQFGVDNLYSSMIARDAGNTVTIWIPVQKGETCTFNTNANMSNVQFKFVYAEGEENV